ncbi:MAG: hypothetical protein J6Y25_06690 [Elusimicrobiaceae bacterium]|nr:hypothetical protein [Elusimicrobiaceae bacterium]
MRYWAAIVCVLFAGTAFGYNESVSAISYNPSRTGVYKKLTIVNKGTLAGGLEAAELQIHPVADGKDITIDGSAEGRVSHQDAYINHVGSDQHNITVDVESGKNGPIVQGKGSSLHVLPTDANHGTGTVVELKDGTLTAEEASYIHDTDNDPHVFTDENVLNKVTVKATTLIANTANTSVNVSDALQLGNVTVSAVPGNSPTWRSVNGSMYLCY